MFSCGSLVITFWAEHNHDRIVAAEGRGQGSAVGGRGQLWEVGLLSYDFSKFRKTGSLVFSAWLVDMGVVSDVIQLIFFQIVGVSWDRRNLPPFNALHTFPDSQGRVISFENMTRNAIYLEIFYGQLSYKRIIQKYSYSFHTMMGMCVRVSDISSYCLLPRLRYLEEFLQYLKTS